MKSSDTAVCTIVSNNYLAQAKTFLESVRKHQPGWNRYLLIVDRPCAEVDYALIPANVDFIENIGIPNVFEFLFQYSVIEANTAAKPWYIKHIYEKSQCKNVIYYDPDIALYSEQIMISNALKDENDIVLLPHITAPIKDDAKPTDHDLLLAGAYNLGFFASRRSKSTDTLIEWWCEKSKRDFIVSPLEGYFTDQRWMDLAPTLIDKCAIIRDHGYDTAYWNIFQRSLHKDAKGHWRCGDVPLAFFHFSGFNPHKPSILSKHQNRVKVSVGSELEDLLNVYARSMLDNGHEKSVKIPYAFNRFSDNVQINDIVRRAYWRSPSLRNKLGKNPFLTNGADFAEMRAFPRQRLPTIAMLELWNQRRDLHQIFPDIMIAQRDEYASWFVESARRDHNFDEAYIDCVRKAIKSKIIRLSKAGIGSKLYNFGKSFRGISPPFLRKAARSLLLNVKDDHRASLPIVSEHNEEIKSNGLHIDSWSLENGGSWSNGDMHIDLQQQIVGEMISIELYQPGFVLKSGEIQKVSCWIDGELIATTAINSDCRSCVDLILPNKCVRTFRIVGSCIHSPRELGINSDTRPHAFIVISVSVDRSKILCGNKNPQIVIRPPIKSTIQLFGHLVSDLGIGESARSILRSASTITRAVGIDTSSFARNKTTDNSCLDLLGNSVDGAVSIVHLNADQCLELNNIIPGYSKDNQMLSVGYWYWELGDFPERFIGAFAHFDEIWTSSLFTLKAISSVSPIPVCLIPPAVLCHSNYEKEKTLSKPFTVLVMYDTHSVNGRKNPTAAVRCYLDSFADNGKTRLIIKTMNGSANPNAMQELKNIIDNRNDVEIIDETLTRSEICMLQNSCDVLLSLHRSEGFGLIIAECMLMGKSVVGTAWSGNADFMDAATSFPVDYNLVPVGLGNFPYDSDSIWADPIHDSAVAQLRYAYESEEQRAVKGLAAHKRISEQYSLSRISRLIQNRLYAIGIK